MESCKICSQELKVELEPDEFDEATSSAVGGDGSSAPDDLLLTCGCHFHWYVGNTVSISLSLVIWCLCSGALSLSRIGYSGPD